MCWVMGVLTPNVLCFCHYGTCHGDDVRDELGFGLLKPC